MADMIIYICGKCHSEIKLKLHEAIMCKECGHRILYAKRITLAAHTAR